MRWQEVGLLASVLAGQVAAGALGEGGLLVRRSNDFEQKVRRYVETVIDEPVARRQASTGNSTAWNTQTEAACTAVLEGMKGTASNPSGLAVCYNLPSLDNTTGIFQADLRLFSISPPTGAFVNVAPQDIQVGLTYNGATVSAVDPSTLARRSLEDSSSGIELAAKRSTPTPTQVQEYAFVGQINQNLITKDMSR